MPFFPRVPGPLLHGLDCRKLDDLVLLLRGRCNQGLQGRDLDDLVLQLVDFG
jgi:hypothetical protein